MVTGGTEALRTNFGTTTDPQSIRMSVPHLCARHRLRCRQPAIDHATVLDLSLKPMALTVAVSSVLAQETTQESQQQSDPVSTKAEEERNEDLKETSRKRIRSQGKAQPGFVFVNFDNKDDEIQKKNSRKLIRSRATAHSHRVAPRGQQVRFEKKNPRTIRSATEQSDSRRTPTSSTPSSSSISNPKSQKRPRQIFASFLHTPTAGGTTEISRKQPRKPVKSPASPRSYKGDRSLSPRRANSAIPDLSYMDAGMRDPFCTLPVQYLDWYGKLINFWHHVVCQRATPVLKASQSELDAYTIWSRRQELAEPALFYTALFLASGIPVAEGLFPLKTALWLRQKAVQAIQEAIDDPQRALSVPVILAVGRIALHEHIYGNRAHAHNVHRPAQLRYVLLS